MKDRSFWLATDRIRSCPLCACWTHLPVSGRMQHKLDLQTVACSKCGYVFTNPMPPPEIYERFYVEAYAQYYGHISPPPIGTVQTEEPDFIRKKLDQIERVSKLCGKRILEVGPGQGLFLHWARKRGCEVYGVEPSIEFCRSLARAQIPHLNRLLLQINPAETDPFDVLVMTHVLEHFYDPAEALNHCRKLLVKDGLLIIEVPNILKPFRSLDRFFLRYVHPCSFSPSTLKAFLQQRGFSIQLLDEGGTAWHSPQNIFVIAAKSALPMGQNRISTQKPEEVLKILRRYRRTWKCKLAPMWMLRDLWLWARKAAITQIRTAKQKIFALQIATST